MIVINCRTNPRDSSRDAIIVGDLVRPDKMATILLGCEQIAGPVGEVSGIIVNGRISRNISTGREYQFWFQALDVAGTD
jgi:hypothetical protein